MSRSFPTSLPGIDVFLYSITTEVCVLIVIVNNDVLKLMFVVFRGCRKFSFNAMAISEVAVCDVIEQILHSWRGRPLSFFAIVVLLCLLYDKCCSLRLMHWQFRKQLSSLFA